MNWQTGIGTLSGDFLTAGSKGRKADIQFGSPFRFGQWTIEPHIGAEWLNNDNVDYYYGVTSAESRPWRDQYTGKSSYNFSAGTRFDYRFTPHQNVSLDVGVTRLGSGITDSPLVDKTVIPQVRLSYLYRFQ
jgi:outer membrane protein